MAITTALSLELNLDKFSPKVVAATKKVDEEFSKVQKKLDKEIPVNMGKTGKAGGSAMATGVAAALGAGLGGGAAASILSRSLKTVFSNIEKKKGGLVSTLVRPFKEAGEFQKKFNSSMGDAIVEALRDSDRALAIAEDKYRETIKSIEKDLGDMVSMFGKDKVRSAFPEAFLASEEKKAKALAKFRSEASKQRAGNFDVYDMIGVWENAASGALSPKKKLQYALISYKSQAKELLKKVGGEIRRDFRRFFIFKEDGRWKKYGLFTALHKRSVEGGAKLTSLVKKHGATLLKFGGLLVAGFTAFGVTLGALYTKVIPKAVEAFREFNDAVASLRNTMSQTSGLGQYASAGGPIAAAAARMAAGNEQSALALARASSISSGAKMSAVVAGQSSFLQAGFSQDQTNQLSKLATSIVADPKSRIKDYSQAVQTLSDVMNGSVEAAKQLGIFVKVGGSDAQSYAVAMGKVQSQLQNMYGGISQELVNPSQKLAATWDRMWVLLGSKLTPIFDKLVTYVNHIMLAIESGEADQLLADITSTFEKSVQFIKDFINLIPGLWNMISGLLKNIWNTLDWIINSAVAGFAGVIVELRKQIEKVLGEKLMTMLNMGVSTSDIDNIAQAYDERARMAKEDMLKGNEQFMKGVDEVFTFFDTGKTGGIIEGLAKKGAELEKQASDLASVNKQINIIGQNALDEYRRRAEEERRTKMEALRGYYEEIAGQGNTARESRITLNIKNTRPDRFRGMRSR